MRIGALTSKFTADGWPLERIIAWAGETGLDCLEIERRHIDCRALRDAGPRAELQRRLDAAGVGISALSAYTMDLNSPDAAKRAAAISAVEDVIDAAAALAVPVVCTLAGHPTPGKSKMDTIHQDLPAIFAPLIERAARLGIKLALENYWRTNIQHLDHWKAIFEVLPHPSFGLNFDPSHLDLMDIDYLAAIGEFAPRIFHTHAKDVLVDAAAVRRYGVVDLPGRGFCVPGTGRIAWGPYLARLRRCGFDGAVSIENEDNSLPSAAGFRVAHAHLRPLIPRAMGGRP